MPIHTEASPEPAGSRHESAQKDRFECTVVAHLPCYTEWMIRYDSLVQESATGSKSMTAEVKIP